MEYLEKDVIEKADAIIDRAKVAAALFCQYSQEEVDRICRKVYEAAFNNRVRLARLAWEETHLGQWKDKVIKNVVASLFVYDDIKDEKTVGVISEDEKRGIMEVAQPLGPVLALIPVTNPTSTVIFKILIAMKTRNPVIIGPHPRAYGCSVETARICYKAALEAGAPEDAVIWLEESSMALTSRLMGHESLALVLATGGAGLVKAAYSSGKPALGVGPGNVPVYIERSADVSFAVKEILASKNFDNGTVCASEQAVIVDRERMTEVLEVFTEYKAYILSSAEVRLLEDIAFDREKGLMRPEVVGLPASRIAEMAGIRCPEDTSVLIAPLEGVGKMFPLSSEILAPILAFYVVSGFREGANLCIDLNFHGGKGHTVSIFSRDEEKIREFAELMNAGRILVNMPSSQGAVGGICSSLHPSFTLGCGTGGNNITTDNITARHLLNIQRVARRRMNPLLQRVGLEFFLDDSVDSAAVDRLQG